MKGFMQTTLVYNKSVNKGLQSVLFVRSHVYDPLQAHVTKIIVNMGV